MTADKQWTKGVSNSEKNTLFSTGNDKIGYKFEVIDKTLLDQLRRDAYEKGLIENQEKMVSGLRDWHKREVQEAKKELLDEIDAVKEDVIKYYNSKTYAPTRSQMKQFIVGELNTLRAKTLGEKVNTK